MTHQDVIDALEQLGRKRSAAYREEEARIAVERTRLQAECARIGHFFAKSRWPGDLRAVRICVFCCADEPSPAKPD
ncbi:hypothetical protein [Variovorax paradoxus]|uniref:hypothetical protein n=1 Tax=Variovorax paradoxus TaxID=34073 RepID=UPI0019328082|nr:hypothetical protein INQ48_13805 [Variovorax paradoxus]